MEIDVSSMVSTVTNVQFVDRFIENLAAEPPLLPNPVVSTVFETAAVTSTELYNVTQLNLSTSYRDVTATETFTVMMLGTVYESFTTTFTKMVDFLNPAPEEPQTVHSTLDVTVVNMLTDTKTEFKTTTQYSSYVDLRIVTETKQETRTVERNEGQIIATLVSTEFATRTTGAVVVENSIVIQDITTTEFVTVTDMSMTTIGVTETVTTTEYEPMIGNLVVAKLPLATPAIQEPDAFPGFLALPLDPVTMTARYPFMITREHTGPTVTDPRDIFTTTVHDIYTHVPVPVEAVQAHKRLPNVPSIIEAANQVISSANQMKAGVILPDGIFEGSISNLVDLLSEHLKNTSSIEHGALSDPASDLVTSLVDMMAQNTLLSDGTFTVPAGHLIEALEDLMNKKELTYKSGFTAPAKYLVGALSDLATNPNNLVPSQDLESSSRYLINSLMALTKKNALSNNQGYETPPSKLVEALNGLLDDNKLIENGAFTSASKNLIHSLASLRFQRPSNGAELMAMPTVAGTLGIETRTATEIVVTTQTIPYTPPATLLIGQEGGIWRYRVYNGGDRESNWNMEDVVDVINDNDEPVNEDFDGFLDGSDNGFNGGPNDDYNDGFDNGSNGGPNQALIGESHGESNDRFNSGPNGKPNDGSNDKPIGGSNNGSNGGPNCEPDGEPNDKYNGGRDDKRYRGNSRKDDWENEDNDDDNSQQHSWIHKKMHEKGTKLDTEDNSEWHKNHNEKDGMVYHKKLYKNNY
ncbi:hypothetical protein J3Q64DRAFT_1733029 [Phycomyces blakesleeanus]|uniref:Uncharacterized protein n=1 Tax=Phycomyces blakesleeanus TaxID=4837 RepID=A0ABR3B4Y4_PHYBL